MREGNWELLIQIYKSKTLSLKSEIGYYVKLFPFSQPI